MRQLLESFDLGLLGQTLGTVLVLGSPGSLHGCRGLRRPLRFLSHAV